MEQVDRDYVPWAVAQGHTIRQIAEHLDRSESMIRRVRQEYEGRPRVPRPLSDEQVEQIATLVPQLGLRATAATLGLGRHLVQTRALALGVRSPHPTNDERRRWA